MIKRLLSAACICCLFISFAQAANPCTAAYKQVIINITPDNFPQETHWSLHNDVTNALIDSGTVNSDTICVDTAACLRFTIFDAYGDGICCNYGQGSYLVKLNGLTVVSGGSFGRTETTLFNCAPGHDCNNAIAATKNDTITAPGPDTWYTYTPDSTGLYNIFTCGMGNTCDTKIYVYDHCVGLVYTNDNQGTIMYNDDNCANYLSLVSGAMQAGHTYYIRIGQYDTSCAHHLIHWRITYQGPIRGCMDSASCNYNPLATIPDTNCVYPPSPMCPAPDLSIDGTELKNSMYLDTLNVANGDCYVNEGCLAGYGHRRLLRFSTHIRNIGAQDYFIGAPDTLGHQFVWDPCHQHWHYVGYAEYLLYDQNNQQVQVGFKNGFCVLDLECSGGGTGKFTCANMGITAGCGDIYNSALACQWIDITQIDTGRYTLVVRVNWDRSPDKLGHYESRYDNNWSQVCLRLYYANGQKYFDTLPACPLYVDCAGDTFGNAVLDCAHTCGGSAVRGDLNTNIQRDSADLGLYLTGMTAETLTTTSCNDLNGDGHISVVDAARLNGCLRKMDSSLTTLNNPQSSQHLCEFPYNVYNPLDSVVFSIGNVNWQQHYLDLSIYNPLCKVMGYELKLSGITIDSTANLAIGNYTPDIHHSAAGHITELSNEDGALFKQLAPLNFLRVYYSHLADSTICIASVIDAVNEDYQQVLAARVNACVTLHRVDTTTSVGVPDLMSAADLRIIPNPSAGSIELYTSGQSLYGAGIHIYDAVGQAVYEERHFEGLSNKIHFDLTGQAAGVYLMQISLGGTSVTKRFVISR